MQNLKFLSCDNSYRIKELPVNITGFKHRRLTFTQGPKYCQIRLVNILHYLLIVKWQIYIKFEENR